MARSKRKSSDDTPSKGVKRRKDETDDVLRDSSVFGELVNKAGFVLKVGDKSNELTSDQTMFQRDLELTIKRHPNFPQVIEEFTEALSNHIQDSKRLLRALMPTTTAASCESSARSGNQESLLRLLLGIDQLQPAIMNMLLEKLAEFTEGEEPVMNGNEEVNMPRLILSQFRWLNNIVNSKEVTEKMLEIICVVSQDTQREIITCIPEVVDDAEHNNVANELKTLLTENSQLAVPILDVLSNLSLKEELLTEVRRSVISTLDSVSVGDLPVIVRFLLQTVTATEAVEVITEFRQHLDFQSNFSAPIIQNGNDANRKRHSESSERSSEALVLDSIRSGIRFQRCIADGWVKAIEAVKASGDHRIIDVFVVFILHSCGHKKTVEGLVRGKVRAGHFTELLLRDAFGAHTEVLREYFSAVLALSEVLLRSPEPVISFFAAAMYRHAFLSFDAYCQQEIVGSLVTHIGSGLVGEVDIALDVLSELVQSHTDKIAPFGIFVKGVLDYLENLSMGQIRKLYGMLSTLAFRSVQGESQIQDELYIIIRKQLSNTDTNYKKMGVIGAIMVVQSICTSPEYIDSTSDEVNLPHEELKQVTGLLTLVRSSTASSPPVTALFMDELSTMVSAYTLDPRVSEWINDYVMTDFQDDFVVDVNPESLEQDSLLSMDAQYSLDADQEGAIAINLLPIIAKSIRNDSGSDEKLVSPVCLSPEFRLLQTCERRQNSNNLEDIDALLGCPLYVPKPELVDKMGSMSKIEKHTMCDSLLFTINWFREVVNAFASQVDPEVKVKVILRLQHITELQNQLPKYMAASSGYCPRTASFDEDPGKMAPLATTSGDAGKKGRPKKGKKKEKDPNKTTVDGDTTVQESQQVSQVDVTATTQAAGTQADRSADSGWGGVRWAAYRPYLRELDMDVFLVLQLKPLIQTSLDSDSNVKDTTEIQLKAPQLELLLDDLVQKLEHILVTSSSTRRSFFKSKSRQSCGFSHLDQLGTVAVVRRVVKLMPALCDHLESTSAYFQAQVAANDGVLDGPGSNTVEALQLASCFQLLLVIINSLCSWAGFAVPDHRDMLKGMLTTMCIRLHTSASTQSSVIELVTQSFQYIENFSSTIPNISTAVTLIRTLASLVQRADQKPLRAKIADLAVTFLKREWRSPDGQALKGAQHNELLQELLRTYLSNSENTLSALDDLATTGFAELLESDNQSGSETYPTLTKNSFPVFYRVMLAHLVDCTKGIAPYSQQDTDRSKLDKLLQWNLAVRIFHIHVNIFKACNARPNLLSILKYGRQFVDVFLRLGMPLLDRVFRHHAADVQSLLKNLQLSTRVLHHMAGHSKIIRDVSLTNMVPVLKKSLEYFVYRVKAMLTLNGCLEAFWLGNLKNRDLRGEEIMSQSAADASGSDSDSDNLPDDESVEGEPDTTEDVAGRGEDSDSEDSYSVSY